MKKPPAIAVVLLVLMFGIPSPSALAFPIPPVSLWKLVEQADSVVVARVERIETAEPLSAEEMSKRESFDRDVAVLRVLETWKGEEMSEIHVSFASTVICPAPPRFVEGELLLAFLESGESQTRRWRIAIMNEREKRRNRTPEEIAAEERQYSDYGSAVPTPEEQASQDAQEDESIRRYEAWAVGRWFAVGLSYGTLYPDQRDLPVFRELVGQATRLQAAGNVDAADRREWLISAAERRATRWHGLYELAAKTDALHFFYDRERRDTPDEPLTGEELARLASGFVREPSVDATLTMLLKLLSPLPDPSVDRTAAAAIEAGLQKRERAWWLPEAMALVLERFGDPDTERRLRRENFDCAGAPTCEWVDTKALPDIWEQARRELRIPAVPAASVPEQRVGRVGAETPD